MKLSTIPQLYRDLNRSVEILAVLSRYGLADWIDRLDLDFAKGLFRHPDGQLLATCTLEQRMRLALIELGPTFIKLGQMLSTRPDLVGRRLAEELSQLQTQVPPDKAGVVRQQLAAEFGQPIEELFSEFEWQPIASASIGQVHRARLLSGQEVVVKVQHPDLLRKIRIDLEILGGLAELAQQVDELKPYCPRETTAEFRRCLLRELDFSREERNLIEFRHNFEGDDSVVFPCPISTYCTNRVLTMEYLQGTKISDVQRIRGQGHDLQQLARQGAETFLQMIFEHGFYHADPHPGNILVLADGSTGIIDCGMVGRVDEKLRENIEDLLVAISQQDAPALKEVVLRIGLVPEGLDHAGLEYDLGEFVSHYLHVPLDRLDLGAALWEMTEMLNRYHILLPSPLALLVKTLIMLEGSGKLLNPQLSLTELIQPFQRRLFFRRLNPMRQLKKFWRAYREWSRLAEVLPKNILEFLQQMQSGRFEVQLEHHGLEPSVNRLVLGMLASSLFLGSAILWATQTPPLIHGVSLMGCLGCATAILLGLRVFWAIRKSGKLDRQKSKR